ncbi:S8 family serine peptidase [Ornithinimicrobium cavernae]|uniref:S8 family serine peptidase n=1 Tax=Ornithinimicrobium cavernae TaxID=2666047 RepID=UPI00192A29FE|nr:S8 family serine peptidase [Ornithinimicrobium cavernae]
MERRTVLKLSAVAAASMFAGSLPLGQALATTPPSARLDPQLAELFAAQPGVPQQAIVTFRQSGPPTATQSRALSALGIDTGVLMHALPIAGVVATAAQVESLCARDDVVSVFHNARLTYFNSDSREITGARRAVDNPKDFGRTLPFSGKGVTVLVNDSGIDAAHDDVKFGPHVIENVLAPQNVLNEVVGQGILPLSYVEGVVNTDLGSGHGTHCAGTVGGTGARSNGYYRGVAPGAKLIGYGSGAVLFILDAVGGLDYAAVNQFRFADPIRVTSNSWGSSGPFDPTHPVNVASYELYKRGIVSVFAAGNDGPGEDTHNPYSQAPWVISVGAGEKDGRLADFSSRGKRGESGTFTMPDGTSWVYRNQPDVVATGVDVISVRDSAGLLPAPPLSRTPPPSARVSWPSTPR